MTDARFDQYLDLLQAANQTMNLTRIVDRPAARVQHIGDSLTLLPFLPVGAFRLTDVGSGGGAPGIPLAIARPDASITLIEATKKKAAFLRDAVAKLGLQNVVVIDQRVENVGHDPEMRRRSDVVVARAVGTMIWIVEWCLPLAKIGGKVLAMKGPKVRDELPIPPRAMKLLGGGEPLIHPVELAETTGHVIVSVEKISRTDKRYPRDPTIARGQPMQ